MSAEKEEGARGGYETSPAEATDPGKVFGAKDAGGGGGEKKEGASPPNFNRALLVKILAVCFAAVFLGALIFNTGKSKKKTNGDERAGGAGAV